MKFNKLKENIFAVIIAFFLAFGVIFLINKTDFLKADIVTKNQEKTINSDLSYKINNSKLSIISNKSFEGVLSLSMYMIYDNEKVKITKDDIESDHEFGMSSAGEGRINIILTNLGSIKVGQNLLNVSFSGDDSSINLSDLTVKFTDEHGENLTITNNK